MAEADIGLIGLAVMGQNLVLNMNDHNFTVAVFNRTVAKSMSLQAVLQKEQKWSGPIALKSFVSLSSVLVALCS
jgi:6-phosphogluconate dehydrogenase